MTIPTADMQEEGRFMAGANYMPQELLPSMWDYNSGNYFLNITFLPFMEVGYRCTLMKLETGKINQDRSVTLRLRPLKEGKWWPSIVVGSNDLLTTGQLNPSGEALGNRYFASIYGVATKSFRFSGHEIAATVGYNIATQKHVYNEGQFYGVSYCPSFAQNFKLMAEMNRSKCSLGVSALFWKHLSLHLFYHDFKALSTGIRYEITLF